MYYTSNMIILLHTNYFNDTDNVIIVIYLREKWFYILIFEQNVRFLIRNNCLKIN